jgi:hypothetical protein
MPGVNKENHGTPEDSQFSAEIRIGNLLIQVIALLPNIFGKPQGKEQEEDGGNKKKYEEK